MVEGCNLKQRLNGRVRRVTVGVVVISMGSLFLWSGSAVWAQEKNAAQEIDEAAAQRREEQIQQLLRLHQDSGLMTLEQEEWSEAPGEDWSGVRIEPWIDEAVGRLNDVSYEEREQATVYLIDGCPDLRVLYSLLSRRELTAEQRHRLLEVVRQQLLYRPRGAIGINMDQTHFNREIPGEVKIDDLLPNLPAEKVLRVGDRISHIDGQMLMQRNELILRAQSKLPGEQILLTVQRPRTDAQGRHVTGPGGQLLFDRLEIPLVLGSADKLVDPATGRPVRGGPVMQQRQLQATQVALRFAADANRVDAINRDAEPFFSASLRITDEMIEQHVEIQLLIRQIEVSRTSQPEVQESYRSQWMLRLAYLRQQAVAPEWSDLDRQFFQRLADRYAAIVEPVLR